MTVLHRPHRFARLLVVWLLLWFVVMAVPAPLPLAQSVGSCSAEADGVDAGSPIAGGAEHEDHAAHAAHQLACADAQQPDAHAGHGSGAATHCPLCLHAAAPPPPWLARAVPVAGSDHRAWAVPGVPLRVRTDAPPPARGPPRLS